MRDMKRAKSAAQLPPPVLDNLAELGRRIGFARRIQRLRQDDLSVMAGISRSTLTEIEKGSPTVSIGSYMATLWAMGIMNPVLATEMTDEEHRLVVDKLSKRIRHA